MLKQNYRCLKKTLKKPSIHHGILAPTHYTLFHDLSFYILTYNQFVFIAFLRLMIAHHKIFFVFLLII